MKVLCLFVLAIALCSAQSIRPVLYDISFFWDGFELIHSNTTSFLDEIQFHRNGMYVAGEGSIHLVNYEPFNISHWPYFRQRHTFQDFSTFIDTSGNTWAVGPVANQWLFNTSETGMNYPFYITGTNVEYAQVPPGHYMMGAVYTEMINNKVYAFWAGWHQHWNASEGVNFTVIRTTVDPTQAGNINGEVFKYNYTGDFDRVDLHSEGFQAYNRLFKPWMFHSFTYNHLVIVDPASNFVFRIGANATEPLSYNNTNGIGRIFIWGRIVGATYDPVAHRVYLGIQGWGTAPGMIAVIDVIKMYVVANYTLGMYEGNPTALALDWGGGNHTNPKPSNHLYVGLYGGWAILKIDVNMWTTVGYATLPQGLHNVYAIAVTPFHVYFTTYEQVAKVGRVNLTNFCPQPCDGWVGYCSLGACACPSSYRLAADRLHCEIPPPINPTAAPNPKPSGEGSEGGEIALGILFAIAVVVAAAGWYMVYKGRQGGGYEKV